MVEYECDRPVQLQRKVKDLATPSHQPNFYPKFSRRLAWAAGLALIVMAAAPSLTSAFSEPNISTSYPTVYSPSDNIAQFLNPSTTGQIKAGNFAIGDASGAISGCTDVDPSSCSRLCLNSVASNNTGDLLTVANRTGTCIESWQDLQNLGAVPYLHNFPTPTAAQTPDQGYSVMQGDVSKSQLYSLILEPNTGIPSNALRAEGRVDMDYAATFAGTLFIGNASSTAQLCLNDLTFEGFPGSGTCIKHWSDLLTDVGASTINLQNLNAASNHVPDVGSAATSGEAQAANLIIGLPPSSGPAGVSKPYCGDNFCSHDLNEDVSSSPNYCSSDCF